MIDIEAKTADETGLWISISELAARKSLTRQTLAERVARLEAAGQLVTRPGKGKAKLVNLAAFDRAAGETVDLGRAQGAATRRLMAEPAETGTSPPASTDPVYTLQQARLAAYRADLAQLELDERRGKLLRSDRLADALATCGEEIIAVLSQFPKNADALAEVVGREGAHGLRVSLKACVQKMRTEIADAMHRVAATAPATDPQADDAPL